MLLNDVFERFAQDSPVPVMVRGLLENTLSPQFLDELFENVAERQYTRTLLFSSVVDLMGLVVNRIRPRRQRRLSRSCRDHRRLAQVGLQQTRQPRTRISAALVRTTATRLETVVTTMGGALPPLLPGYRVKILDGNHLASTEHRIKELRTMRAGALPGQSLVVLDPSLMLAIDVVLCEDGHAQERSLLDQVLADRPYQGRLDRRPELLHDRVLLRDRPPRGVLRGPSAWCDAALGIRGQKAGLWPDRHRQGLRADGAAEQSRHRRSPVRATCHGGPRQAHS